MPTNNPSSLLQSKNIPNHRRVAQLTHRRMATFDYLKRLFLGVGYHMGTVAIPIHVLAKIFSTPAMRKRAGLLFQLGIGIGKILRIKDLDELVKAFDTLLTEFDALTGETPPKLNLFARLNKTFGDQQIGNDGPSPYGLLEMIHLPFEIDFMEAYISICELLVLAYLKFAPTKGSDCPDSYLECIQRLDVKKHIIHGVIKEMDAVAKELLTEQLHMISVSE
ncbi:hypothetical protein BSLG_009642 [Batrachochytrium salamandrivorans]|nr:hypothetical protein BSLG_009642 [Batrachochytrium salamandrivorans]